MTIETPPPLPDPIRPNWVWRIIRVTLRNLCAFWMRYRARGFDRLPPGGALLLINHQSFLDPLLVGLPLRRPVSYLARDNLFRVPVIGWILRNTYVMPIRRDAASTESLREAARRLEHGFFVGIFPEGTRSPDGSLGPLKPGFVALLRRCRAPLVPVGIAGAVDVLPRGAVWLRPRRVHVVFGEPILPEVWEPLAVRGREAELLAFTTAALQRELDAATAWKQAQ